MAQTNYYHPRPRPIDPAVFFDLVKIRRLVDDATNLAVRAASGVVSGSAPSSQFSGAAALGFGFGQSGRGPKLSAERRHRLRVDATQRLSQAYHLDEIACSVATMQSASALEDVASLVLQRTPQDPDAQYVHFFHEKIPSRQLAECTSLVPLDEVIADRPAVAEPLRTRAVVKVFKEDYDGAVVDLSEALRVVRFHRAAGLDHKKETQVVARGGGNSSSNARKIMGDAILDEDKQPSSLEIQLLFQRAGVYLAIACQLVEAALPPRSARGTDAEAERAKAHASNNQPVDGGEKDNAGSRDESPAASAATAGPEPTPAETEALARRLEARKTVRANAKRAIRDYLAYLSHFDYSPNLPVDVADDFSRKVSDSANGGSRGPPRTARPHHHHHPDSPGTTTESSPVGGGGGGGQQKIYTLNELFAASPPSDLAPYPSTAVVPASASGDQPAPTTETITYHPLLTDALHGLLLAHSLVQTSSKELLRHAYMVARLTRLADGYPIFQACRSPARADWIEVLRRTDGLGWLQVQGTWESLCAPAPLPAKNTASAPGHTPSSSSSSRNARPALPAPPSAASEEDHQTAPPAAPGQALAHRPASVETTPNPPAAAASATSSSTRGKRWAIDDGREYPIVTERAAAVARWVREAPASDGDGGAASQSSGAAARRRKKGRGAAKPGLVGGEGSGLAAGTDEGHGTGEKEGDGDEAV